MSPLKQALVWVENAKEGATEPHLLEDFEPIGGMLLDDMLKYEFVTVSDDCDRLLTLTASGRAALEDMK